MNPDDRFVPEHGPPNGGLLPANSADEYLLPADPRRVMCTARRMKNKVATFTVGFEQTGIIHRLSEIIAQFDGLNITGMCAGRLVQCANAFLTTAVLDGGDPKTHAAFLSAVHNMPWFEPGGRRFQPELLIDLDIAAPDRAKLLRDVTGIISLQHGANVETLVNQVYPRDRHLGAMFTYAGGDGFLSYTRMKLELDAGTNLEQLKKDVGQLGKEWMIRWGDPIPALPNDDDDDSPVYAGY